MSKEDGGVDLFGDGGEIRIIPCGASLTVDTGDGVAGVITVPAEPEAVAVEVGRLGGIGGETLARVEGLSNDGAGGTGDKVSGADRGAKEGAEATHGGSLRSWTG